MRGFAIGFGTVLVVGVVALVLLRTNGRVGRADPNNQAQVRAGQAIYGVRCASCHGADLQGQPNWKVELPMGGRLRHPTTRRVTRGITLTRCCSTSSSAAVRPVRQLSTRT